MRNNRLSNRVFKTYDDIVALCLDAWKDLIDRSWKIRSIQMRQWANRWGSVRVGITGQSQRDTKNMTQTSSSS
jgi:hypothetical protein